MVKQLEARVRALDDETLSTKESARKIELELDGALKFGTIVSYLQAKRGGEKSYRERLANAYVKRGTSLKEKQKKYYEKMRGKIKWYLDLWANERGFESKRDYEKNHAIEAYGFETTKQLTAFKKGEALPGTIKPSVIFISRENLDELQNGETREQREKQTERLIEVAEAFSHLPSRQQFILTLRFIEGKAQKETGELLAKKEGRNTPYSHQSIQQLEERVLRELRARLTEID